MKKLLRLLIAVVIVLVVAVGLAWYFIDSLAKAGIENGASYALGVPTTVDKVNLSLLKGSMVIDGLTVANPEGYETPHLVKSGRFDLEVDPGTVFGDKVHVSMLHLNGLDMNIEQKGIGKSNVSQIMDNLKRFEGSGESSKEAEPSGKKVAVDKIVIENVVAHVQLLPVGGKASTVKVEVPKIELENIDSDNAKGVAISELTARILPKILEAVLEKGGDIIPGDLAGNLRENVSGLLKTSGEDLGKNIEKAKENLEEAGKDIRGKLEGLIPNKKPEE